MIKFIKILSIHGNEVLINMKHIVSIETGIDQNCTFIKLTNSKDVRTNLTVNEILTLMREA